MVVGLLWRAQGNSHGFVRDGKSYGKGCAAAQTPTVPLFPVWGYQYRFNVRPTSLLLRAADGDLSPIR